MNIEKIEKIWLQIEKMINKILLTALSLFLKLRPKWVLKFIQYCKQSVNNTKHYFINAMAASKKKFKDQVIAFKTAVLAYIKSWNTRIDTLLKTIKHIKPRDIKNSVIGFIKKVTINPFLELKNAPLHKSFGYITALSFIMWGVYNLHYSKEMYGSKTKINRKIASVKEDPTLAYKKPAYHLKRLRSLPLTNVQLPILIKGTDFYKSTNADFSIVGSNKQIVLFLDDKEELLRDHLMMNIREIHPEFTLTSEGKKIIEDKILKETQIFIDKYEVKGIIEEVNINNILANP